MMRGLYSLVWMSKSGSKFGDDILTVRDEADELTLPIISKITKIYREKGFVIRVICDCPGLNGCLDKSGTSRTRTKII